jgi:hypothetical protein
MIAIKICIPVWGWRGSNPFSLQYPTSFWHSHKRSWALDPANELSFQISEVKRIFGTNWIKNRIKVHKNLKGKKELTKSFFDGVHDQPISFTLCKLHTEKKLLRGKENSMLHWTPKKTMKKVELIWLSKFCVYHCKESYSMTSKRLI